MPGYTGFIPGVKAENVFSKTYAHSTNASFAGVIVRGANPQGTNRYSTVTGENFSPDRFRRIVENKDMASRRDYLEYTLAVNRDQKQARDSFLASPSRKQKETTHAVDKRAYVDASETTVSPFAYRRDLNGSPLQQNVKDIAVKPRLIERGLAQSSNYQSLPEGFQKVLAEKDLEDQAMRLPVVGYSGHRKGLKAENVFAKNFRDATIGAERNLRERKITKSNHIYHI